ncbi:hypothetical protein C7S13_8522 [Burkholderia cepacia]|nr:hypothetical protein [Burkholderia cepacia]
MPQRRVPMHACGVQSCDRPRDRDYRAVLFDRLVSYPK